MRYGNWDVEWNNNSYQSHQKSNHNIINFWFLCDMIDPFISGYFKHFPKSELIINKEMREQSIRFFYLYQ